MRSEVWIVMSGRGCQTSGHELQYSHLFQEGMI
jgi:mannose-6-phosphate isomerase-like protein (cupin superfamily)